MPDTITCLEKAKGDCFGSVEYRHGYSGRSFPRCDHHWNLRIIWQEGHTKKYPDSPCPPRGFDPGDAGETWDDEPWYVQ